LDPPVPTNLSIRTESRDGIDVLLVAGEIDASTATRLAHALVDRAEVRVPWAPLVADLTAVPFIDSTGARILSLANRTAAARGSELLIVPSEFVSHVLEVSGLIAVLRVHSDLNAAVETARELAAARRPGDTPSDGG
jgi:anti-anti-sigma factor